MWSIALDSCACHGSCTLCWLVYCSLVGYHALWHKMASMMVFLLLSVVSFNLLYLLILGSYGIHLCSSWFQPLFRELITHAGSSMCFMFPLTATLVVHCFFLFTMFILGACSRMFIFIRLYMLVSLTRWSSNLVSFWSIKFLPFDKKKKTTQLSLTFL
jgi:hypothetical protein